MLRWLTSLSFPRQLGEWAYDYSECRSPCRLHQIETLTFLSTVQIRREVDSTHGFHSSRTPDHAVATGPASSHVKPSSVNSSEVRLRHAHEVAANDGHEIQPGEESRLSGRTIGEQEGPNSAPPNNSREAAMAAGMQHGHGHDDHDSEKRRVQEKDPATMV